MPDVVPRSYSLDADSSMVYSGNSGRFAFVSSTAEY